MLRHSPLCFFTGSLTPEAPESAFHTHHSPCATPLSPEDTCSVVMATRVLPPTLFNNFSTVKLGRLGAGERAVRLGEKFWVLASVGPRTTV